MAITADEIALLDRYTFGVPVKIKLGTLIKNAETGGGLAPGSVSTADLADGAVTAVKIGALAVGTAALAVGAVTTAKFAASAVDATALATGAVTTAKLAGLAVDTAALAANGVTLAKLAAGITPSHVVKFAGKATTVGGAASEDVTISGVAATDVVNVTVQESAASVTLKYAKAGTNKISLTFSADPAAATIVNYEVLRAAS